MILACLVNFFKNLTQFKLWCIKRTLGRNTVAMLLDYMFEMSKIAYIVIPN